MSSVKNAQVESPDLRSPRGLRSPSSSSDVMSTSGRSLAGGVPMVNPPPLFVAQTAAETLTSTELERPVAVSEGALEWLNSFLDQTLYNLLSLSKSTSLATIRLAVPKLLKPRLGQAALSAGEEEVRDILEASEFDPSHHPKSKSSEFDLELVWKLARMRCMVYSRLGDLEEEDEEELLEEEGLSEHMQNPKTTTTPIEALFLAAILGFLGEQALATAAQHAERRHGQQAQSKSPEETETDAEDELVLEPVDMLQLGREGPLSRLWRSWRRDARSTDTGSSSRPGSLSNILSTTGGDPSHAKQPSLTSKADAIPEEDSPKSLHPSQIPLPIRDSDVDEIEVPGVAPPLEGDEDTGVHIPERSTKRPNSALFISTKDAMSNPMSEEDQVYSERSPMRPQPYRKRSQSAPTRDQPAFNTGADNSNRNTAIFSPNDDTVESDYEEAVDKVENHGDTVSDETQLNQTHQRKPSGARSSIISGTVAAIAGALGVEAMKQSRMSKDQQDQSFNSAQRGEQPRKPRTVAEEILGPNKHVAPPKDAQTGASITGPSDFDSMYVPPSVEPQTRSTEVRGDRAVSDPEDLALSSADEETLHAGPPPPQYSSRAELPAQQPVHHSAEHERIPSVPSSPSSPKRVKREAAVYENSMIPMQSNEEEQHGTPVMNDDRGSSQRAMYDEQNHDSVALPIQQPAPIMTNLPQRGSSRDQSRKQHAPGHSKSSQYSQQSHHSRTSGSSSSARAMMQNGQPQNMNQQRAAFSELPQGGHSRNTSKEQRQSGNMASGRQRMSEDEQSRAIEQKKKSLEILIKSDETLHYTLTPESARETEFSPNDIKPKTNTQDLADFIRNTGPPGDEISRPSTSRQNQNALRSNPPESMPAARTSTMTSTVSQRNIAAPRDARPERNTTRDLADYVRSTGPADDAQLAQALGTKPSTGSVGRHGGLRSDGVPVAPAANSSMESARASTTSDRPVNRLKFQARDARPARNTETSELIDFIREGPPRTVGDHRIDRNVAPFRTTMDSDDLNALAPPPEVSGRESEASAFTSRSVQDSNNSRTALLETSNRANGRNMNTVTSATNGVARQPLTESNGMPPRTRRNARDPYALDDSDDELEPEPVKRKPVRQEESLIDFLRNTAPPPGMSPQPILAAAPRVENKPDIKRSASNSRLKDVLTRQGSSANNRNSTVPNVPNGSSAREASPHLTQVGSKRDKYRPTQPTHNAHYERSRQKPRGEARAPTNNDSTTADLADYLRNSGPPEAPRQPVSPAKDQAGFLKFFSRRGSFKR